MNNSNLCHCPVLNTVTKLTNFYDFCNGLAKAPKFFVSSFVMALALGLVFKELLSFSRRQEIASLQHITDPEKINRNWHWFIIYGSRLDNV